jgi:hypothetical protein
VLLLKHPVFVFVFKQKLCLSLARWLGSLAHFFPLCFSGSCLVSSSLSEVWLVLRFWRSALWSTSCPALDLGFFCVGLLGTCFFASPPVYGARSEIHQPAPCCSMLCWFADCRFNFAKLFDLGCCSLAQEMSFVDCYLPYFRQWLITCLLSTLLPFQSLFTENSHGIQLFAPPPFTSALRAPHPLCCVSFSVPCLLFRFFFFLRGQGVSLSRGLCWFIPGVAVGIPYCLFAHLLVCQMSPKQCNVVWKSFVCIGVQEVEVLILLCAFFLPSVASASQQKF